MAETIKTPQQFAELRALGWSKCMHDSDCGCSDMVMERDNKLINEYLGLPTADDLERRAVEKIVNGALKQTIDAHGAITMELIPSASKRIMGQLKGAGYV